MTLYQDRLNNSDPFKKYGLKGAEIALLLLINKNFKNILVQKFTILIAKPSVCCIVSRHVIGLKRASDNQGQFVVTFDVVLSDPK